MRAGNTHYGPMPWLRMRSGPTAYEPERQRPCFGRCLRSTGLVPKRSRRDLTRRRPSSEGRACYGMSHALSNTATICLPTVPLDPKLSLANVGSFGNTSAERYARTTVSYFEATCSSCPNTGAANRIRHRCRTRCNPARSRGQAAGRDWSSHTVKADMGATFAGTLK